MSGSCRKSVFFTAGQFNQVCSWLWPLPFPLIRIKENMNTCLCWGVLPSVVKAVFCTTHCLTVLWFKVCTMTIVCTSGNTSGLSLGEVIILNPFKLFCWPRLPLKLLMSFTRLVSVTKLEFYYNYSKYYVKANSTKKQTEFRFFYAFTSESILILLWNNCSNYGCW